MKAEPLPRRRLTRLDLATDTAGLAPSLISAIETDGGLWSAGDAYTSADEVITAARHCGAVALRLDFRDLSRLSALPSVRYLHIRTDGRPQLHPAAALSGLRALIVEVGAVRGQIDPGSFSDLTWLRVPLGGKGGAALLPGISRGHPRLEWLALREELSVLHSMPSLVAVRRGKNFTQPVPWPDLNELASEDSLRVEWAHAMRE